MSETTKYCRSRVVMDWSIECSISCAAVNGAVRSLVYNTLSPASPKIGGCMGREVDAGQVPCAMWVVTPFKTVVCSGKHFIESVQELVEKACSDTKPAWPSGLLETQP